MSFDWPVALLALLAVPAAVGAYVVLDRRRASDAARFATPALFPNVVAHAPGRLRHVPAVVLLLGLAALLTGFARPHANISVKREEATVVLALDVSRSMTATDVQPTRLAAAQAAARHFLEQIPARFRVGVVTFATRAHVATPPTADRQVAGAALSEIRSGEGTALGEAIELSLRAARSLPGSDSAEPPPASVLLISDGAQTQGDLTPRQAAQRARAAGVPVSTIVLGTANGVVERTLTGGYRERIRVPPDPAALRHVATTSGGEFFQVVDDVRLRRVYEELGSRLGHKTKRTEITVAFAGAGLALFVVAGGLSMFLLRRLP
ncbi:MAG: VWA domain-containing protein [Thermoleophilia bacterium]|nr:VWA domain-containing protein [Thermoleophilia bacterium]